MSAFANAAQFDRTPRSVRTKLGAASAYDDAYLRARGFGADGSRYGGIAAPKQVTVPIGATLFRVFKAGDGMGQWWMTAAELRALMDHIGHTDLAMGRTEGKGALHAFLAIHIAEFDNTCEFFVTARVAKPAYAFYGEGDHLLGAKAGRKAPKITVAGRQRGMCQVFLPSLWEYKSALAIGAPQRVENQLANTLARTSTINLSFEV